MPRTSRPALAASERPSVVLRDVVVRRGRRTIAGPASFELRGPALVRLVGENGSGKSTLLRVMAGLQRPTAGRRDASHAVGLLPERFAGAPELRVGQLVDAVRRAAARPVDPVWRDHVFGLLQVEPLLDRPLGGLSHGQSQRTALAAALHVRPPILLLDEPWDGLDADTGDALRDLLHAHAADALVVVTDHGPAERSGATVEARLGDGAVQVGAVAGGAPGAPRGAPTLQARAAPRGPAAVASTTPADVSRIRWETADGVPRSGRLSVAGAEALERLVSAGEIALDEDAGGAHEDGDRGDGRGRNDRDPDGRRADGGGA